MRRKLKIAIGAQALCIRFFAAMLLVGGSVTAAAEPVEAPRPGPTSIGELQTLVDAAFERLAADDVDGFAEGLEPFDRGLIGSFMPQLKARYTLLAAEAGPRRRVEFVRRDMAGDSYARLIYFEIYDDNVVRWSLSFMHPNDRWVLQAFNVTPDWNALASDFSATPTCPVPFTDRSFFAVSELMDRVADRMLASRDGEAAQLLEEAVPPRHRGSPATEAWGRRMRQSWLTIGIKRRLAATKRRKFERIDVQMLSPSFLRFVYLDSDEKDVISWEFYFYKPHDEWLFVNSHFSDAATDVRNHLRPSFDGDARVSGAKGDLVSDGKR